MATIARLWKSIEDSRIQVITGRYFLPQAEMRKIFTLDAIVDSVNELSIAKEERIGLTSKIFNEATTIFAILIWMRRESAIVQFRQHHALDSSLPIDVQRASDIVPDFGPTLAGDVQWEFLPYTFRNDMCDYHVTIRNQTILPFVEEQYLTSGGFGDIFKMKIVSSQQEFFHKTDGDPIIIRKRLKPKLKFSPKTIKGREPYEEEMTCLRLLHRLQHPNIVKLLGSYTYKGEHNFLFPCLDQDLSDFFELDHRVKAFEAEHTLFEALYGLASALENVHVLKLSAQEHGVEVVSIGYHHDLRPENVLVHGDSFLLADFGLSKFKDEGFVSQTAWKAGAGDYIAPECMDKDFAHQQVGRAIDVWAFGCLMAEALTYLESGKAGLDKFRSRRASTEFLSNWEDQYFFGKNGIKPAVSQQLQTLASRSRTTLVPESVDVVFSILQIDPHQRPTASETVQQLSILSIRAHFLALKHALVDHLAAVSASCEGQVSFMKLWFEKERLSALETLFGSYGEESLLPLLLKEVRDLHDRLRDLFNALLKVLRDNHMPKLSHGVNDTESHVVDLGQPLDAEVQSLVQQVWVLFPVKYQRRMEFAWRQKLSNVDDVEQLRRNWMRPGAFGSPQYDEFSALAAMRALRLQFLRRETADSSKTYILQCDELDIAGETDSHSTGVYNGRQVLIEWEYYSLKWENICKEEKAELMALKAEGLGITPKPPELNILDCLGFVETSSSRHGYGFLYAFPSHNTRRLMTLFSLLDQDMRERKTTRQPLLRDKFQLAAKLVACLLEIHTVGWLHENINSNNVLFFNVVDEGLPPSLVAVNDPYLVDFRHSRPDSQIWYTQGPSDSEEFVDYRHPAYSRGTRFRTIYDYYSMGVVLLEIGLWNPLSYLTANYRTATPEELGDVLINKYVPRLGPRMGSFYRDAVLWCLRGDLQTGDADNAHDMQVLTQFAEKVVEPLEGLARLSL